MRQLKENRLKSRAKEEKQSCLRWQSTLRKGVSWAEVGCFELRNESLSRESERKGEGWADILLYSSHFECFFKPKNCQINIPDQMKQS